MGERQLAGGGQVEIVVLNFIPTFSTETIRFVFIFRVNEELPCPQLT